ncbi:glycosyltransferase [Bacillus sp. JJ1566]|uniref:glycosyltransferase family 2 protein n=1 Tax=Bacillus sp. JJ1566 TaxID=3122961 RepID=UPI003000C534
MNPKISIIVPVYKVEAYLRKCIDSILSQSFTDFELILVNDGSPDNCGYICDEYSAKDSRIKVIHKVNGGLSDARNAGIEVAIGEYIGFVDSDDYINEKMYELLYVNAIEHSSEVVICDVKEVNEEEELGSSYFEDTFNVENFTNIEALEQIYERKVGLFTFATNKLYKRYLFEELRFNKGKIYEDEFILHKILYLSKRVTFIPCELYYYLQRSNSILNSPYSMKKFDKVSALKERVDFFYDINQTYLQNKALKSYIDFFIWNYFVAKDELQDVNKELKEHKGQFNRQFINILKNPLISAKQKMVISLFIINPFIFEFIKILGSFKKFKKQYL